MFPPRSDLLQHKTECKIHSIIMFQSPLFLAKMAICRDHHTTLPGVISSSTGAKLGNSFNLRTWAQNTGSENNSVAFDDSMIIACLCEHCPVEPINMYWQKGHTYTDTFSLSFVMNQEHIQIPVQLLI